MSPLNASDHVVVVGAGLAGWRLVTALRQNGYEGALTLIGDETHAPYDRPPLSKQVLEGKWPVTQTVMATGEKLTENSLTLRLGDQAVSFDRATTTVTLASGEIVRGTHVTIATGTRARHLPFGDGVVHYLRSYDDVTTLLGLLNDRGTGIRVAVIGGGFIGAEAATALTKRGCAVTVYEAASLPLVSVLGPDVASWLGTLPELAGVELRVNQQITDVRSEANGASLVFADGTVESVDVVLAGVGALPNTEWLAGSGLEIDNGVLVDELGLVEPTIAAIGDVARATLETPTGTEQVRIEHWQVANDHATRLAKWWALGERPTEPLVPYFWSDQYGKKIQVLGRPRPTDAIHLVKGDIADASWLALYVRGGVVTGVVALSQPRALMVSRVLVSHPHTLARALEFAPWSA